ncbi:MAG: DUF4174 domain-containing protein [Mangrovicoccus sp.]|nr:DUF4174 domain-containing protein [Mangrovicoccus sp.]
MKILLSALVLILTSIAAQAQDSGPDVSPPLITPAEDLDAFLWTARPIVVFADTPNDPRFVKQLELLEADKEELWIRDVVVLTDTDPKARSPLRTQLRPRGFQLVLIGKDGQVKLRKPAPWSVREITRQIDKMPLRRQEIRDAKDAAGAG